VWGGCALPSLQVRGYASRKCFEILHANRFFVFFGVICVGQQCLAKIYEGRKDTLAQYFLLEGGGDRPQITSTRRQKVGCRRS